MAPVLLTFGLAAVAGLALFVYRRGPRLEAESIAEPPSASLPEMAVLRDGAVGATRWAFAALIVKLARDGHCTLVRTRKRRWLHTGPALTVELHADPTALSALEQTILRQIGRHGTLGGFGFAGSTFRRRTLRDVRADLVERSWLTDRHRQSNALLGLAFVLAAVGVAATLQGGGALASGLLLGGALGSAIGAFPRYPVTEAGAQRRAAHRAHADRQCDRVRACLSDRPKRAWPTLVEVLPALVLERIATPRWLTAVGDRIEAASEDDPDWIRDEIDGVASGGDACRTLARVLKKLGARAPLPRRLPGPSSVP